MKKIVLFAMTLCIIVSQTTKAQPSCQSLFSNIVKAADGVIQKVSNLEQSVADALGPYIVSATTGIPASFMTSSTAKNAISNMANDAIAVQNEILGLIGAISGDGKGHIGPRYLYIPTKQVTGELIGTERTFIVTPSSFDKVIVTIKKRDGKAGAGIAACAKWADGREYNVKDEKYFASGTQTIGQEQQWVFANMKDKYLTIHLVHTGIVTDKFDYEMEIEGEWNADNLYAISTTAKPEHTGMVITRPEETNNTKTAAKPSASKSDATTNKAGSMDKNAQSKMDVIDLNTNSTSTTKPSKNISTNKTTNPGKISEQTQTKITGIELDNNNSSSNTTSKPAKNNVTVPTKSEAAKNSSIRKNAASTANKQVTEEATEEQPTSENQRNGRRQGNKQQNNSNNNDKAQNNSNAKEKMKDKKQEKKEEESQQEKKDKAKEKVKQKRSNN